MLNPVFSIKHIRNLTPVFFAIAQKVCTRLWQRFSLLLQSTSQYWQLRDAVAYNTKAGPQEVDMLEWMSRAALEIIGQGGLGCSIDSLRPDVDSSTPFGNSIKNVMCAICFRYRWKALISDFAQPDRV